MVMQINKEASQVCGRCRNTKKLKHEFKHFQFSTDLKNKQDTNVSIETINLIKNHESYLPKGCKLDEQEWKTASLPANISKYSDDLNDTNLLFSSRDYLNTLRNKNTYHTSSKLFKYNFPSYECRESLDSYQTKSNDSLNDSQHGLPSNSNFGVLFNTSANISSGYLNKDVSICEHEQCDSSTLSSSSTPKRSPLYNNYIRSLNSNKEIEMIKDLFVDMDDGERNKLIGELLDECNVSQIHFLSTKMESLMHRGCPVNCSDFVNTLPSGTLVDIMKLLDPVSLANAGKVCRRWRKISKSPVLWSRLCKQTKWSLISGSSKSDDLNSKIIDNEIINWNRVFAGRYRLRLNWLRGKSLIRTFEGHTQYVSCLQFDGTRIVSGSSDKTIRVWDIRTNSKWSVQTLTGHSGTVRCLALAGGRLVSGATDMSIKVWDLSTDMTWSSIACKVTMTGHSDTVRCLQADDDKVISGSYDCTLKVWQLKTGQCTHTLRGHTEAVICLQFKGNTLVSGSHDKTIKIWNLPEGTCLGTLNSHRGAVTCIHFTDLCDQVVTGSFDCTIKFWDLKEMRCTRTIDWKDSEGHTAVIRCLQADKWRLMSGSDDGTIKMWNLETGERLVTLKKHTDGVTCLRFNDRVIVSGSYDKTVKLWDFNY